MDERNNLYNKYYYIGYGKKISSGRLIKAGSIENMKLSYKNAGIKAAFNFFNISIDLSFDMDINEVNKIVTRYKNCIGFCNKNPMQWKLKHLENKNIINEKDSLSEDEINKLYSEYLSRRYSVNSLLTPNNGYKKSKKGWYKLNSTGEEYFYRSSWEQIVLKKIDALIELKKITSIEIPERISYKFDGRTRHYYPDIGYIVNGSNIVLEIKPSSKLNDPINVAKINEAKNKINNFIILTEKEIFVDSILEQVLLNKEKANV